MFISLLTAYFRLYVFLKHSIYICGTRLVCFAATPVRNIMFIMRACMHEGKGKLLHSVVSSLGLLKAPYTLLHCTNVAVCLMCKNVCYNNTI